MLPSALFSRVAVAIAIAVLSCTLLAQPATALETFGCETVWPGPSVNNTLDGCIEQRFLRLHRTPSFLDRGVGITLAAVLLFAILIPTFVIAFFWCFFCQCCCSCCQDVDPSNADSTKSKRQVGWVFIIIAVILSILVIPPIIYGVRFTRQNAFTLTDDIVVHVSQNATDIALRVEELACGSGPDCFGLFTREQFNTSRAGIERYARPVVQTRDTLVEYSVAIQAVGYTLAFITLILILYVVLFACLRIRRCGPAVLSVIMLIVSIAFVAIGIACLLGSSISMRSIGEELLNDMRAPGVAQWYLKPQCEDATNFTNVTDVVIRSERMTAYNICQSLLTVCSPNPVYDPMLPQLVFQCQIPDPSVCTNMTVVNVIVNATTPKLGVFPCIPGAICTLNTCPMQCTNATLANLTRTILGINANATALFYYLDPFIPLMNCQSIIDFSQMQLSALDSLNTSSFILGVSFFAASIILTLGWILMMCGPKMWFDDEKPNETLEEEVQKSEPEPETINVLAPQGPHPDFTETVPATPPPVAAEAPPTTEVQPFESTRVGSPELVFE